MKEQFIKSVEEAVGGFLSQGQIAKLSEVLSECMQGWGQNMGSLSEIFPLSLQ